MIYCKVCKTTKPTAEFYKYCINQNSPTGICIKCRAVRSMKWKQDNRGAVVHHVQTYRGKHPEKAKKMSQEVYARMKQNGTLGRLKNKQKPEGGNGRS